MAGPLEKLRSTEKVRLTERELVNTLATGFLAMAEELRGIREALEKTHEENYRAMVMQLGSPDPVGMVMAHDVESRLVK